MVIAAAALWACGDDTGEKDAGSALGAAVAADGSTTTGPAGQDATGGAPSAGDDGSGDSSASGPPAPSPSTECVDPEGRPAIPAEAAPPTTIPGSEPSELPNGVMSDEMLPQFGALVVDVGPQGCIDIATRFRADQRVQMITHADDGILTRIEVFGPDGASLGAWETGERGTIEGQDFYNEAQLPADGTYVFRITHLDGSDDPFMIAFYGDA